jgi:hypothetical protein
MRWRITKALGIAGIALVLAACSVSDVELSTTQLTTAPTTAALSSTLPTTTPVPITPGNIESETVVSDTATPESTTATTDAADVPTETTQAKSSPTDPTTTTSQISPTSSPPGSSAPVDSTSDEEASNSEVNSMFGPITCRDYEDNVELTHLFYDVDRFEILVPMGRMWDSHVTPTDHLYAFSEEHHVPGMVNTPASGRLITVGSFPREQSPLWDPTNKSPDLRIVIAHSCTLFSVFIHAGELAPEIAAIVGEIEMGGNWFAYQDAPIELEAGDPVAFFAGSNLDYSLHDETVTLTGFQIPEHYGGERWKVHTVDPFDYMTDDIVAALLPKNVRQVEPYGGKIDYDVVGTLAGNWFMDGTVDYGGGGIEQDGYWNGHLSIAYDHVDPERIRFSVGRDIGLSELCRVCGGVYAVMNNSPDPASITAADGVVIYELTGRTRPDPDDPERSSSNGELLGSFITQVIDDETIRTEFLLGIDADSVQGFSDESVLYRR